MEGQPFSPTNQQTNMPKKPETGSQEHLKLSKQSAAMSSRVKILEERYANLRKKAQLTDQNLLDFEKNLNSEIKLINEDLMELKRNIHDLVEKLEIMKADQSNMESLKDIKVLDKYLALWEPMNFVTREELKKLLMTKSL